jgi:hypothetical protein
MNTKSIITLILALSVFPQASAFADPVSCVGDQKVVTFADGNNVSEVCMEEGGGMTFTPSEETYVEGEIDPNNDH